MEADPQPTSSRGQASQSISNAAVQTLLEFAGRGPTRARTHITGDLVTIVLGDTLTRAEQTLVDRGGWPRVEATRLELQQAMKETLIAAVEGETGRQVVAFMSSNHCDPDLAVENFLLAPRQ